MCTDRRKLVDRTTYGKAGRALKRRNRIIDLKQKSKLTMDFFEQESAYGNSYPKREKDVDLLLDRKKREIEKLKFQVAHQGKEISILKARITKLEKEVEELTKLKGNHNCLIVGEVCRRLQANLYQYVFPGTGISPFYSYKMANLDKDIEKIKSGQEKDEAITLWEDIKQKEHPERFQELVKKLQKMRNATAHPEITDKMKIENVLKAAKELNEQKAFAFLKHTEFSFEDVEELIKMWDRTEKYVKDLKK